MKFKLTIAYQGTNYRGWQFQPDLPTVQGAVLEAVQQITGDTVSPKLVGAGRTDKGVHAIGQVAHLDLATPLPPETLQKQLNSALPDDIHIRDLSRVHRRFDARTQAVRRSYVYQFSRGPLRESLKPFATVLPDKHDASAMRRILARFVGLHDFRAFSRLSTEWGSTVAKITRCDLLESTDFILVHIEGDHFLWNMVRRIIGASMAVACGRLSERMILQALNRRMPAPELPEPVDAKGLFLHRVYYADDLLSPRPRAPLFVERRSSR